MRFMYVKQYCLVWRIFYMWFIQLLNTGQLLEPNHCYHFTTITLYLAQIHNECILQNVFPMHRLLVLFKMETLFFKKNYFVYFCFFSFLSTGRKKIGEAKWATSVHITWLARDAVQDLAVHCKYMQFHHSSAWNISAARVDIQAFPAGAHHFST